MKVYIIVDQDYDTVVDVTVYSDKKFILDKLYNERKEYIKSLNSSDERKEYWLNNLEELYKNEVLDSFGIFEKEII